MHPCLVHFLVIGKVTIFSVVDVIVAVLEVVNVKVPPVLEGVVAKVACPQGQLEAYQRGRLEGTEPSQARLFCCTASRRMMPSPM